MASRRWCFIATTAVLVVSCASKSTTTTMVSLTFDDTFDDSFEARPILLERKMHATFYVNSSRIGHEKYMTLAQLQQLESDGNEIASHTVNHADLPKDDSDEQRRQICDDRVALLGLGFHITSFAYPHGDDDVTIAQVVKDCGFNSARAVGGFEAPSCTTCPPSESTPPTNPFAIRTPPSIKQGTALSDVQAIITKAESTGGGWVPLVMHHVCDGCNIDAISTADFRVLLQWLDARKKMGTVVRTVQEVMGGSSQPAVPGPLPPQRPATGNLLQNPSLETTDASGVPDCWSEIGTGTNVYAWAQSTTAHDGKLAQQLKITSFTDGERALISRQDLGSCAPAATPGHNYVATGWYTTTSTQAHLVAYVRTPTGWWDLLGDGPLLAVASTYTLTTWALPALPPTASALSVGISLDAAGTLVADDFALHDFTAEGK